MAHALALPEEVSDGCTKQYEHAIARRICEAASYKGSPVPRGSHSGVAWKRVSRGYALREDLVRALKLIAIDEGRKLYEVIEEALEQYLRTCQNQQEPEALISPTPVGGQSAPRAKQRSTRPRAARLLTESFLRREYGERGRSSAEIGAAVGVRKATVEAYLRQYGLTHKARIARRLTETFLRQEYIERGRSPTAIAADAGVTRSTIRNDLLQYGIPPRGVGHHSRKYALVDGSGFIDLATDWHAYWVGFLAADGYIRADGSDWEVHIRLKAADAPHLAALKDGLHTEAPIQYLPNQSYPAAQIILRSRPLVEALAYWGIVPNKTLTMPWPDHLPAARIPAYIRGYFDGDGTVYQRQRSSSNSAWRETMCRFISGSVPFLDGLERELNRRGIHTRKRYRNQSSNAYGLPLSGRRQNLLAFASLIYDGSTIALARKRAVFESLRSQPGKERP